MNFTTKISIPQAQFPIDYNSKIISLGSCFAENMSEKLDYFKFQNTLNPFGIIFNPVSIEKIIFRAVNQVFFKEEDVFFYNERWHSFEVHSECSGGSKAELLENWNAILQDFHNQILQATHIIITYGSSWVYRNIENNAIVANCHKVPQKQFSKEILSVETIQKAIENSLDLIKKTNPNCHFIFTVSPVRHIKDGFVENQRSKSHLIAAIQNVLQSKKDPKINYFPSYEIMMDELRDYRFYGQDMLHPSPVAIDYIWEQFFLTQITPAIYPIMNDVCSVQKGFLHKPFDPESQNHQQFLAKLQAKIATMQHEFPHIRF
jgi:lysophospholipase L1-like esterase